MALYDYQSSGIASIKGFYTKGKKKVLLYLATGGGKTHVFCEVLKGLHEKGNAGIVVVRGRKLVDQASKRLLREGVPHGVFMAGHKKFNPDLPIQICSIDTLRSRGAMPDAKLIVVDEAHFAVSSTFKDFLAQYNDALILSVTATPFTKQSIRHLADEVVCPIKIKDLLARGFLVDGKYYAPRTPDLSNVEVSRSTGDYNLEQLQDAMSKSYIVGDVVKEWLRLGEGRSTLVFCSGVQHSKQVRDAFLNAGVPAEHIDANVSDDERDAIIARLESGEIKVITSIGTMTTGVDIPSLGCIVFARPTQSYILYVQMLGRGTRPFKDKKNFLVLDHAGNLMRHGRLIDVDAVEVNLDGKKSGPPKVLCKTCPECYAVMPISIKVCSECEHVFETKERKSIVSQNGELEELKSNSPLLRLAQLTRMRAERKFHYNWIWHKMKEEFGEGIANQYVKRYIKE